MAKRIAARHRGRAQDVARRQLLERRERLYVAQPGGGGGELELRRIARDGRTPGQTARDLAQAADLLAECRGDRGRHADQAFVLERQRRRSARDPGQLL